MTEVAFEFSEIWNAMPDVFRNSYHKFSGGMFYQESGGVILELIKVEIPTPRPIRKEIRYGDIGVNKITIAVSDITAFYKEYRDKVNFCSEPKTLELPGWGEHNFVHGKDPESNYVEFISSPKLPTMHVFGGGCWAGLSVTDLNRSMEFYQSLGFDTITVSPHDRFTGYMNEASGSEETKVRSCLMANSNGLGLLELSEFQHPRGRSIPLNSRWGDFGYLEISIECDDIHETAAFCRNKKMEFLHKPALAFEEKNVEMWFMYVYDPDGIPVEIIAAMPK
ncbi:MAG: VOC family protein, partial [Deltaproteobacteria bacterium]|nr:VOC family protein [Deltaproteobacteria bacterium]